jgi:hypothetical protein
MGPLLPGRTAQIALVVAALAVNACVGTGGGEISFEADGTNIAEEPTSLDELGGLGGGSHLDSSAEEIASSSDVAIEAEIVDVQKSYLNTEDGRFPSGTEIGARGLSDLEVLTDVVVRVVRTVAAANPDYGHSPGTLLTITVGGGSFETMLDLEQATALGMTNDGDDDSPDDAGGAVYFTYGRSPGLNLTEGDRVVVFLLKHNIRGFGESAPMLTLLSPAHPLGVFRDGDDGIWRDPRGREVDLEALAVLVDGSV